MSALLGIGRLRRPLWVGLPLTTLAGIFDGWKLRLQQRISGMHIIHSEMLFLRRR